jgi:dipeptidyl aminopeptidase/acylaminoacyl peptidase
LDSSNLSTSRKIWIILYGLLATVAAVVLVPIGAFLLALAFTLVNQATRWFELGETGAWLGIIFALYALYADVVIGPLVWWKVSAKRLGLSRKVNNIGTAAVITFFSVVCLWVIHGEQAITNPAQLEDVSDDGKFVLVGSTVSGSSTLYKVDTSTGSASRLAGTTQGYGSEASISPDSTQVVFAYSKNEQDYTIMLTDLARQNPHPVLAEGGDDSWPRFSRDGRTIYFVRTTGESNQKGFDLFSTSLDGRNVTQLTHQHFSFNGEPYLHAAPVLSSDGKQLLFTTDESLELCSLSSPNPQPSNLLFQLPNAPRSRQYVSAYFSPDDRGVVFMAASEGKDAYNYDAYRVDLQSRKVQKLTENNGYASDFRLSVGGNKAVFLKWKFSRFQKLPRSFQLQLMDMQSGAVTPVNFAGLPK